ncbi:MAG: twin-arginine translocase TatA/TatE family subunit [Candidatus Kapabacteria bacterium]|jgi:sec-independent protein translocase protein TatA|nr:twin-arginine translocase TatA/TatE family subunit [Candidatus Kapabacteria bacterium]
MFDVGGGELLLVVIAILLLFGPEKLPELARSFGKGMSHLRNVQTEFQRNLNAMADEVDEIVQKQPENADTSTNELPKFERYMDSFPQDTAQTPFEAHTESQTATSTENTPSNVPTPSNAGSSTSLSDSAPKMVIRPAENRISTNDISTNEISKNDISTNGA